MWLIKVVEANQIHYEVEHEEDRDVISMRFRLESALSTASVIITVDDAVFESSCYINNNPGKRMLEVGEFILRYNENDSFGHFTMNCDNGTISYLFSAPYSSFEKDSDLTYLWLIPCHRFDQVGDALLKVILGCVTPKEAYVEYLKKIEQEKIEHQLASTDNTTSTSTSQDESSALGAPQKKLDSMILNK